MQDIIGRVAIVTIYGDCNIGNKLQNYALQQAIRQVGFEPETIVVNSFSKKLSWKGWLVVLLGIPRKASYSRRLMLKRTECFRTFSRQWLKVRKPLSYNKVKRGVLNGYDAFVCGSDQVWHGWTKKKEELEYYFLRFTEKEKRVCYAPSFGFDEVSEQDKEIYKQGLNGFPELCCREMSGCDLINHLTGRNTALICDPTMLLSVEEWNEVARKPAYTVPERYILVYFLGEIGSRTKEQIKLLAQTKNMEIINILTEENVSWYCTRPDEFIYLVDHAKYVCTDSFHGSVFSILYGKDFTVFQRGGMNGPRMKGRIQTLLKVFQLEKCADIENIGKPVDYSRTADILKEEKEKGMIYLRKALSEAVNERPGN